MDILAEWFKKFGFLHHAYLILGDREALPGKLLDFFENNLEFPTRGNPDFSYERFDVLSIDDARRLREAQTTRPITHTRKIFVLDIAGMTVEAQNALLKMFEEPAADAHLFLITSSADVLLPTLRSRMVIITDHARAEKSGKAAEAFLNASPAQRLIQVAPIIEEKNREAACELLDSIIAELCRKNVKRDPSLIHELLALRCYLADRSPSLKLILEHVAVTVLQ